jgi:hypothetical protein
LLKASAREDAKTPPREKKDAVTIADLIVLVDALSPGLKSDAAIRDTCLVAFWGLARLGEVTYATSTSLGGVTVGDVRTSANGTNVALRDAKTAEPGELQLLRLSKLPNALCLVAALIRLTEGSSSSHDPLFAHEGPEGRVKITKHQLNSRVSRVWREAGRECLSGHSFRVGGASFRFAIGISPADICKAGRWISNCYWLYIQQYTALQLRNTLSDLRALDAAWKICTQ